MSAPATSLNTIREFLGQKRFAMVGLSRDPKHFSGYLYRDLVRRGYDVVPVNAKASEIFGSKCYPHVLDIDPPVDSVLLMTPAAAAETIVRECAEAGVRRIWMYRATGAGAVAPAALDFCNRRGISVVAGECPLMFLPKNGFHKIHGFIRMISGSYPRPA